MGRIAAGVCIRASPHKVRLIALPTTAISSLQFLIFFRSAATRYKPRYKFKLAFLGVTV